MSRIVTQEEPVSREVSIPPKNQEDILYLAQREMLDEETLAEIDLDKLAAALNGEDVDDLAPDEPAAPAEDAEGNDDEYSGMTMDDLRAELSSRGLHVGGNKADLQARLRENDAAQEG
jgi:hypothetical protein